jgi:abhydrolase domain-containing protein 17
MNCLKSANICVNTIVLPGCVAHSSYLSDDYPYSNSVDGLKLLYIPIETPCASAVECFSLPKFIPVLLNIAAANSASIFCIHFHGNACDIGEVGACATSESYTFMAHYMVVEYPKFGIAEGFPTEAVIDFITRSVYKFVVNILSVPPERIVLIGRSIGTGPACSLASYLESLGSPPAALILHAPYTSLRDAAYDLLGCFSFLFLNRWENWTKLCKVKSSTEKSSEELRSVGGSCEMPSPMQMNPLLSSGIPRIFPDDKSCKEAVSYENAEKFHNPTSNAVIKCPVLFIHADKDLIIDCHHSQMMHDKRLAAGLQSELFIQKSVAGFSKGHNYFDYNNDVIRPCRDFLQKHVPYSPPHGLDLGRVESACAVPSLYQKYLPPSSPSNGSYNEYEMNKNDSDRGCQMDREKSKSRFRQSCTPKGVFDCYACNNACRWALCPCVFCCEASLACLFTGLHSLYYSVTRTSPKFLYETKKARRKDHINGYKVIKALLFVQSIESFIREEEPQEEDSDEEEVDPATVVNPLILASQSEESKGGNRKVSDKDTAVRAPARKRLSEKAVDEAEGAKQNAPGTPKPRLSAKLNANP